MPRAPVPGICLASHSNPPRPRRRGRRRPRSADREEIDDDDEDEDDWDVTLNTSRPGGTVEGSSHCSPRDISRRNRVHAALETPGVPVERYVGV
jgi:hypothetical protein